MEETVRDTFTSWLLFETLPKECIIKFNKFISPIEGHSISEIIELFDQMIVELEGKESMTYILKEVLSLSPQEFKSRKVLLSLKK
jgi:hypothetical protein